MMAHCMWARTVQPCCPCRPCCRLSFHFTFEAMLPLQPGWHDNDLFKMNQIAGQGPGSCRQKIGAAAEAFGGRDNSRVGRSLGLRGFCRSALLSHNCREDGRQLQGKTRQETCARQRGRRSRFQKKAHGLAARRGHLVLMVNSSQCWPDVMGVS